MDAAPKLVGICIGVAIAYMIAIIAAHCLYMRWQRRNRKD